MKMERAKINRKGQALIEFAFCIFFLILLVLGFAELGSAFWTAHAVSNASREGARVAAASNSLVANDPRVSQTVLNYLQRASLQIVGVQVVNDAASNPGEKVKVLVEFPYKWISPFPGFIGMQSLRISRATTMRYDPYRFANGTPVPGNGPGTPIMPAPPAILPMPSVPSILPMPAQPSLPSAPPAPVVGIPVVSNPGNHPNPSSPMVGIPVVQEAR